MSARRNHVTLRSPFVVSGKETESLLKSCNSTTTIGNSISVHILEYLSIAKAPPTGFKDLAIEFLDTSHALLSTRAGLTEVLSLKSQLEESSLKGLEARLKQTKTSFEIFSQVVDKLLSSEKKYTFGKLGINIRKLFAEGEMQRVMASMTQSRTGLEAHPLPSTSDDNKLDAAQSIGYTALSAVLERADPTKVKPTLHIRQISSVVAGLPPPPPSPTGPLPLPPISQDTQNSTSSPLKADPWSPVFSEGTFHERSVFSDHASGNGSRMYLDRPSAIRGDDVSDVSSIQSAGHVRGNSSLFQDYGDRSFKQGEGSIHQQSSIRAKLDPSKDPNSVMPSGETPFTHAMNKTTPMSLIERMLLHGANPGKLEHY